MSNLRRDLGDESRGIDPMTQVELLRQLAAEPADPCVDTYRQKLVAIAEGLFHLATLLTGSESDRVDTIAGNIAAAANHPADIDLQPSSFLDGTSGPDSVGRSVRSPREVHSRPLITPHAVVQELRLHGVPADLDTQCEHTFGADGGDKVRLVTAAALGAPQTALCGLWAPPLKPAQPFQIFQTLTGSTIKPFREDVRKELIADFKSLLITKIMEIARTEASASSSKAHTASDAEVSKAFVSVVLKSHKAEDLSVVSSAFGIDPQALEEFTCRVLYRAKTAMFELLERSPLATMLGKHKVCTARAYVLGGESLREVGAVAGVVKERVRQYVEELAASTSIARAIIECRKPVDRSSGKGGTQSQGIPVELLTKLAQHVERDPMAAYQRAVSLDANPLPLGGETIEIYHERIFLHAFIGSYVDKGRSQHYPPPLRALTKGGRDFFRKLAFACADKKICESIESFRSGITLEQVTSILSGKNSPLSPSDAPAVLRFVEALIRQPCRLRADVWHQINFERSSGLDGKIFSLCESLVRDAGQRRAEQACSVLKEPWVAVWLREERLTALIDARIVQQRSVSSSARELGLSVGSFSSVWGQLQGFLPSLSQLVPRLIKATREAGLSG